MIKGEKAGTALRTMFTNLAKPTKAMKNEMEKLGISITDSNGKMLPMRDVMDQLRGKFKGLSKDQQASAAATIFGKEAMSGALAVINASDEDYKKLTKSIDNSAGASKRMSDEMEGGIGGSIRKMKSAIESLAISVGDVLAPYIRKAAEVIAYLAEKFTKMPGWVKTAIVAFGVFAAALGPIILTVGAFTAAIGSIMTTLGPVLVGIAKAGGLMSYLTLKAPLLARGLTLIGGAFKFMLGPVGIVITAITLLVGTFIHLYKTNEKFRKAVDKTWNAIKFAIIKPVLSAKQNLTVYFNLIKATIIVVWNAIRTYTTSVWTYIRNTVVNLAKSIWIGIRSAFNASWAFIRFVFTAIRNFIVSIWTNIKNRTIAIINSMVAITRSVFNNLYSFSKSLFNRLRNFLASIWNNIRNTVTNHVRNMFSAVRNIFNSLSSSTRSIFNNLRTFLVGLWSNVRSRVTSIVRDLWNKVRATFNSLLSGTRNIFNKVKSTMTSIWQSIKRSVTSIAASLWTSVKRTFNNMASGLKNIIGRIKSHITGMVDAVKRGLNKLIKGVNWVGSKLNMDPIPEFKFHTGTTSTHTQNVVTNGKVNRDLFATVGDKGKGNGPNGFRHETVIPPTGKAFITPATDTTIPLSKGTRILNGQQTYDMLNQPRFSNGSAPKKSNNMFSLLGGGKKPKKHKRGDDLVGDVQSTLGKAGAKTKALAGHIVDGSKATVNATLDVAKKGKDYAIKAIGDVLDYIDNPASLVDKVIKSFGFNFDFVKGDLLKNLMNAIYKKIKSAVTKLFKTWLEDAGGGDGGYIDLSKGINFGFHPTAASAAAAGYPFARAHHGLDINYKHDKVYSTMSGTANASYGWNGGFGNMVKVVNGALTSIYGHLHKLAFTGSKKVRPGTYLGISGGDPREDGQGAGSSTGLHLHYEMQKNGVPFDPTSWLKKNNGGGKSGGKQAPSAWRSTIVRAAKRMGVSPTNSQINGIIAQIQRESGGDASIIQSAALRDGNYGANRARGLLQYVPGTFNAFAVKGHTNIKSGYDQLLAFFNNSNWANDIQYGRSGWGPRGRRRFATGGLIKNAGWYNIAEGGYPEWIIPTDPSRRSDAMKLLALAAQDIDNGKTTGNKRPGQLPRVNSNDNTALLLQMIENQQAQINVLMEIARSNSEIANKDFNPVIDEDAFERQHNRYQDKRERRERKSNMFRGGAFAT
ncbi:phage tail tape measure protein [Staphylococcus canis]|uniref:lysostaphin n=1 Tax=Staphylococcus canis TaxID=2724942 RepID=A0ABS0T8Y3_9STAP|nr:phage tail tape measure protein [Staphylococcus canis]MBI5975212.1 phage tail tape measure protein [Staphylococcus canis]